MRLFVYLDGYPSAAKFMFMSHDPFITSEIEMIFNSISEVFDHNIVGN